MKFIALIDGSTYARSVCDYAAWASLRTNAKLELLHVLDDRHAPKTNLSGNIGLGARTALIEELAHLDAQHAKFAMSKGRAILEDAVARLKENGVSNIETKLRHSDIIETIHKFEDGSDFLFVGKRGESADFAKMHLGSNLERIVRSSLKPIFVASREFKRPQSFLIAYDGGACADQAVDSVCSSELYAGLRCHLVSVSASTNFSLADKIGKTTDKLEKAGFDVSTETLSGHPADVISEFCAKNEIDLLVMGAYGHSKVRSLIIGSTTSEIVRKCLLPVILYR